jgi:selenide,water dikinase
LEGVGDGIGMDCSVRPTRHKGLFQVSTTDYFYPLVEDPYIQGRIGCANVLSDLYAMGVVECDNLLMILSVSLDMNSKQQEVVTTLMIRGFEDTAKEAGTAVTGGQTVKNPWPIIGGVAMSTCTIDEIIMPENAVPGDLIILTKPMGTQISVNVKQWMNTPRWEERIGDLITVEEGERAYRVAMASMSRLNKIGAKLMHKYGAHAATDVTGFGLLGHGKNLARNQKQAVILLLILSPSSDL